MGDEKRQQTAYHILQRLTTAQDVGADQNQRVRFELVHENLEASSADAAIRHFATGGKPDAAIEGSFIAVPSRRFVERSVKVETRKTVTLA